MRGYVRTLDFTAHIACDHGCCFGRVFPKLDASNGANPGRLSNSVAESVAQPVTQPDDPAKSNVTSHYLGVASRGCCGPQIGKLPGRGGLRISTVGDWRYNAIHLELVAGCRFIIT